MRALLTVVLIFVLYQALKTVIRSAVTAYHRDEDRPGRASGGLPGEEMVQDPQCRTYVVKHRAVARRIGGATAYFCSDACADEYLRTRRS